MARVRGGIYIKRWGVELTHATVSAKHVRMEAIGNVCMMIYKTWISGNIHGVGGESEVGVDVMGGGWRWGG